MFFNKFFSTFFFKRSLIVCNKINKDVFSDLAIRLRSVIQYPEQPQSSECTVPGTGEYTLVHLT
ncbi:MAG: hypothetical protein JWR23_1129 [Mucilaginibacter sp.]|nr:hypothetical protein [Mucilaginibacter sp.]